MGRENREENGVTKRNVSFFCLKHVLACTRESNEICDEKSRQHGVTERKKSFSRLHAHTPTCKRERQRGKERGSKDREERIDRGREYVSHEDVLRNGIFFHCGSEKEREGRRNFFPLWERGIFFSFVFFPLRAHMHVHEEARVLRQ